MKQCYCFIIIFKLDTDHSYELKETKTNSKTPTSNPGHKDQLPKTHMGIYYKHFMSLSVIPQQHIAKFYQWVHCSTVWCLVFLESANINKIDIVVNSSLHNKTENIPG